MKRIGLLTEPDRAALAGYCEAYARWKQAERVIDEHGMVYKTPNGMAPMPHVAIALKYLAAMKGYMVELGMTPSARMRVGEHQEKSDDPLERLLD
jgi:P27 family predicted phage terminase small subunit